MVEKEIQFRKKREIGDIFTDSFEFIRQEIKPISKLVGIYVFPFLLLYGLVLVYLQKNVISRFDFSNPDTLLENIGPMYMNMFLFSLFGLFVQALLIAAYYSYIDAYVKKGKGNFDLSEITPQLFANGLLAIGASFVLFLLVMVGVILCIIPGIYFANTYSLVFFILIFEKKGFGSAFSRSSLLIRSQWWNTFLINIVGVIIIWTVGMIMSIPTMITGFSKNIFNPDLAPVEYPDWYWVLIAISSIVSSVLYIILYTFLAFQYFNLDESIEDNKRTGTNNPY
ncbi:MAG TPA: hypothetical protein P5210_04430 [Draconibacterium sp.]|nr:hypothetical protein [Draconibacterium sp.]